MYGHVTRFSDSSQYDEVCVNCGATDGLSDNGLNKPCRYAKLTLTEEVKHLILSYVRRCEHMPGDSDAGGCATCEVIRELEGEC